MEIWEQSLNTEIRRQRMEYGKKKTDNGVVMTEGRRFVVGGPR